MDDMTPSEKVRALLDERGIEWWQMHDVEVGYYHDRDTEFVVDGKKYTAHEWGGRMTVYGLTPEQVIAATVGNNTDLSKRLREVHGLHAFAELFGFDWSDESDWSWHDVACAMADAIDSTVDADYAITFAPTLDRPPETMVGETVFDSEGNAIGWIVNATVGAGTCHIEERHGDWYCTGCGEMVGTCDTASELCIDGNAIELWRHCPQCGARIIKEEIE